MNTSPLTSTPAPAMLTVDEIALQLKVDRVTIRRWIAAGKLRAVKLGRSYRIHPEAVDELLKGAKP